jgi:heme/copper-type cytochrome/quinol oxidase subunit 4
MLRKFIIGTIWSAIIFSLASYASVMISLLSTIGDLSSKPVTNIGFPFTYYYQFWLNGSDSPNCGWNFTNFVYDLIIVSLVVVGAYYFIENRKKNRLKRYWKKNKIDNKFEGLDQDDIRKGTANGLEKYKPLNFFEKYAMYMGVAQLLELRLKQIFVNDFGGDFDKLDNWTLGRTLSELKNKGLRSDFFLFADSVKNARNYIAHELISNEVIWNSLTKSNPEHYTKGARALDKAIIELEQLMFILEWNDKNGKWK